MIVKKKKPEFIRQEGWIRQRIGTKWRRPRGKHSKIRKRRAGKRKRPSIGYKNPAAIRGLTRAGKVPIIISNSKDIKLEKNQIAVLSGRLGNKKKLEILQAARKAGIEFLNVKNIGAALLNIQNALAQRKLDRKKKMEAKSKKAKKEKAREEKKKEEAKTEAKEAVKDVEKIIAEKKIDEPKVKDTSEAKLPRAFTKGEGEKTEKPKTEEKKEIKAPEQTIKEKADDKPAVKEKRKPKEKLLKNKSKPKAKENAETEKPKK